MMVIGVRVPGKNKSNKATVMYEIREIESGVDRGQMIVRNHVSQNDGNLEQAEQISMFTSTSKQRFLETRWRCQRYAMHHRYT